MEKNIVRISLLGTSFSISTDEKPEYIESLVSKLKQKMETIRKATNLHDSLKLAIITSLFLADDVNKEKTAADVSQKSANEAGKITKELINSIDAVLDH